jgi:hypothetical protein
LHQKMQPCLHAFGPCLGCLDEQASHAHVPNARDILLSTALPIHPHVSGRRDAGRQSPGWGSLGPRGKLSEHHGLKALRVDRPIETQFRINKRYDSSVKVS